VLDELGVRTDLTPEESAAMTDEIGFGFYYQPKFNPLVDGLYDRRAEMGVRTFCNTVETLANPANADVHLGSFYHLAFAKRVVDTFDEMERQDVGRVLMFQGLEGYDDIRPGTTVVAEYDGRRAIEGGDGQATHGDGGAESDTSDGDDGFTDYEIRTAEYGMDFEREDLAVGDVAADSARVTEAVLTGEREDRFADAVVLNAALRVYARGDAETIEDGLGLARSAIVEGDAQDRLARLREF